jgi:hypothetical protein
VSSGLRHSLSRCIRDHGACGAPRPSAAHDDTTITTITTKTFVSHFEGLCSVGGAALRAVQE